MAVFRIEDPKNEAEIYSILSWVFFYIIFKHMNHIDSNFTTINISPTAWFLGGVILKSFKRYNDLAIWRLLQIYTVELVQFDPWVFQHPVTSDKNVWSQSISVN